MTRKNGNFSIDHCWIYPSKARLRVGSLALSASDDVQEVEGKRDQTYELPSAIFVQYLVSQILHRVETTIHSPQHDTPPPPDRSTPPTPSSIEFRLVSPLVRSSSSSLSSPPGHSYVRYAGYHVLRR